MAKSGGLAANPCQAGLFSHPQYSRSPDSASRLITCRYFIPETSELWHGRMSQIGRSGRSPLFYSSRVAIPTTEKGQHWPALFRSLRSSLWLRLPKHRASVPTIRIYGSVTSAPDFKMQVPSDAAFLSIIEASYSRDGLAFRYLCIALQVY